MIDNSYAALHFLVGFAGRGGRCNSLYEDEDGAYYDLPEAVGILNSLQGFQSRT